ncbi:hypothetical protein ACWERF_27435 [Streptomyces griseoluteus]
MTTYPEGNFTIVNNETGRALRVRLGETEDVSDHKEGTVYLQYVTERPTLQLGEPDNSPASVWWYSTVEDSRQIVSYAVGEYQNIGDYCVWMHVDTNLDDLFDTEAAFQNRLNDMPADVRNRLAPLIPDEWATIQARKRTVSGRQARMRRQQEEDRAYADAEQEAWSGQDDPPSAADLAALRRYRCAVAEGTAPLLQELDEVLEMLEASDVAELTPLLRERDPDRLSNKQKQALSRMTREQRRGMLSIDWVTVRRLEADSRAPKVQALAQELLPAAEERRAAAALAAIPQNDVRNWHRLCAVRKIRKETAIRLTSIDRETDEDKRIITALDAYLEAAVAEGIVPPGIGSSAVTLMDGCGTSRGPNALCGWIYDGTHIYGSDSKTVPSERTYWTDEDGYLVGKPKGGPGQTWSVKPWTPSKPPAGISRSDIALTGLFGPIGRALGL